MYNTLFVNILFSPIIIFYRNYMIEYINPELVLNNLANLPQLVFEVTDACNLKCKYCAYGEFYDDKDERHDSKLPIESAKRIIDYLVPLWNSDRNTSSKVPLFISFYGGEPLLNMDFVMSIVEYIKNEKVIYHRDIRFSMTTNAVLLHKYMDYLADNNFNLLISLDGNEKNHSYRVDHSGISSFSRVKHNVDILREKYPDYFDKNVNFNSVLHDRSSVQEVYDFIKQNYGKVPNINEINSSGIREDKKEEFYRTYKNAKQSLHQSENYEDIVKGMLYKSSDYSGLMKYLEGYSGNYYNTYLDLLLDEKKNKVYSNGHMYTISKKDVYNCKRKNFAL